MTTLPPSDADGAAEARLRDIERRLSAIETMRRLPFSETYDDDGNLAMRLSADGLVVYDAAGNPQLRAGDLGEDDYGVEIGGGRARAMDVFVEFNDVHNVTLTTSQQTWVQIEVVPPSWATRTALTTQLGFQMHNGAASVRRQLFRIDIDGVPGVGVWSNDVQPSATSHATDVIVTTVGGNSPFLVEGILAINTGTNSTNDARLYVMAIFLR